jgi:hypothetical protein
LESWQPETSERAARTSHDRESGGAEAEAEETVGFSDVSWDASKGVHDADPDADIKH